MHVSRDGQTVTPEVLQGVTDARERLVSHTLNGGAAAAFLKNYRELAAAAFPVTVASLRDSTVEQKGALPWWLIFGRKVKCIPASAASYTLGICRSRALPVDPDAVLLHLRNQLNSASAGISDARRTGAIGPERD